MFSYTISHFLFIAFFLLPGVLVYVQQAPYLPNDHFKCSLLFLSSLSRGNLFRSLRACARARVCL